jgi:hypothetical protein
MKVPIALIPKSYISVGSKRLLAIDLQAELDSGVSLTGTPVITESDEVLILTNKVVSSSELIINGEAVPAGEAVQCLVDATNAAAGTTYTLLISVTTDSSTAETIKYSHEVEAV